jgi:hypothetical protein
MGILKSELKLGRGISWFFLIWFVAEIPKRSDFNCPFGYGARRIGDELHDLIQAVGFNDRKASQW